MEWKFDRPDLAWMYAWGEHRRQYRVSEFAGFLGTGERFVAHIAHYDCEGLVYARQVIGVYDDDNEARLACAAVEATVFAGGAR